MKKTCNNCDEDTGYPISKECLKCNDKERKGWVGKK